VVEPEVRWLADRAQILELTARYNRAFDDGDPETFASLFTADGVMAVGGGPTTAGRDALAEMCRRTPYGTVHATVDATVEVDGDRATQVVTLLVLQRPAPDVPRAQRRSSLTRTARYTDELVRTGAGWRFARRSVVLDGGL